LKGDRGKLVLMVVPVVLDPVKSELEGIGLRCEMESVCCHVEREVDLMYLVLGLFSMASKIGDSV
jgi:hypothetical protein